MAGMVMMHHQPPPHSNPMNGPMFDCMCLELCEKCTKIAARKLSPSDKTTSKNCYKTVKNGFVRRCSNLTLEETRRFMAEILNITDADVKIVEDRLSLLNEIISRFYETEPFQSISLLSTPSHKRHVPTWLEIKESMFMKRGGLCYVLNVFLHELLLSLGFDVYLVYSADSFEEDNADHIVVIAQNVIEDGDKYFIDVGFGYPVFQAIPLNFKDTSPTYHMSYWTIRVVRKTDGFYVVQSFDEGIKSRENHEEFIEDTLIPKSARWIDEFQFTTNPFSLKEFQKLMEKVYCQPYKSYFLCNLHAVMFKHQKAFAFKNNALLLEDEQHKLKAFPAKTDKELQAKILEYFPQFSEDIIHDAIRNLHTNQMSSPHLAAKRKHTVE